MQGCIGVSEQGVWIRLINKLEPILGKIKWHIPMWAQVT